MTDYAFRTSTFYGKTGIKAIVIKNGVTSIGDYAFSYCSGLTSVTIPDSVTNIGWEAFSGCSGLTKVNISSIEAWCKINFECTSSNPLYYAHNLYLNGELVIDLVIPDSITSIGWGAFYGCSGLTSVTIGNSVTSIGRSAFRDCSGLTSVTIPDSVTSIVDFAFYKCSGLTSITIPDSVTSIGGHAFSDCSGLKELTMPCSAKIDNDFSFYNCTNIEKVTLTKGTGTMQNYGEYSRYQVTPWYISRSNMKELVIEDGVKNISNSAFRDCSGLKSITIPDSVTSIGSFAFSGCSGLTSVTIPDSVTSIDDYAFSGCSSLTSITIPDSVTSIRMYVFYGCSGLTSVTIPDSVTSIVVHAFSGCSSLTSITIPNSVTSIGDYAFSDCSSLTSIQVDKDNEVYDSRDNCNAIIYTKTNTLICGCKNTVIPNSVKSIGDDAFYGCSGLTSVTIPDSVTSIRNYVFYGCSGLTSVTIPDSVTSIGVHAFSGCSSLTSITIPDSVTSIGDDIFFGCSGLTSVTIGNSVTRIGYEAFRDCSSLTSITIPDSVTSIGGYAFRGCSGLTSIIIPDSFTSIGGYAFRDCSGLTSVTIPDSVTSIREYAFSDCDNLKDVFYAGTESQWNAIDIYSYNDSLTDANIIFNYVPPHTHEYTFAITTQPTCTLAGVKTFTCACGDTYTEPVAALGHKFAADEPYCQNGCGTVNPDYVPPHTHEYTFAITTQPTCTLAGVKTFTCACGDTYTEPVAALGHKFAADEPYCQNGCGTVNPDYVPPHVHAYKAVVVAPKATALGYTQYKCACGVWKKNAAGKVMKDTFTAPTGKLTLKHSARTANTIKVQWNKVKTATGYEVQVSKDGKKWSTSGKLKAGVTNYTFKKLAAGNNYKFRVRFYITAPDKKNYFSPWSATLNSPTLPAGTAFTKLTLAKRAFVAQWKKAAVNGYQVQYSLNANFAGAKTITVKNPKLLKAAASKLYAGKYYFVRIRTYKTIAGANYCSAWSNTLKVKTK